MLNLKTLDCSEQIANFIHESTGANKHKNGQRTNEKWHFTWVMTSALEFQLLKSPISAADYKDKKSGK